MTAPDYQIHRETPPADRAGEVIAEMTREIRDMGATWLRITNDDGFWMDGWITRPDEQAPFRKGLG